MQLMKTVLIPIAGLHEWDIKEDKFIPISMKNPVHKPILISVPPQRYEWEIMLIDWIFISSVEDVIEIKPIESFP